MKKIDTIPEEVKAQFPAIVKKAIAQGLSCEPTDYDRAEKALRNIYTASKLDSNIPIFWVKSPMVGAFSASIITHILNNPNCISSKKLKKPIKISEYLFNQINNVVYNAVCNVDPKGIFDKQSIECTVYNLLAGKESLNWVFWRGGQFWISWNVYVNTLLKFIPYDKVFDACEAEYELAQSAGYYWPLNKFAIICERPQLIKIDDQNRLHNETGPSISYGPEFELYSWHGTTVPKKWIMDKKSLTAKEAITHANIEQRRAACEILGWVNILKELKAKTIDKDPDPQIGELLEVNLPDIGKEKFLKVLCGTGREFALPVPPEMKTAIEAQAWTWGMDVISFVKPEVRT
jgi:hypothetical protein